MSKLRKATAYVFLAMADGADQTRMNAHGATVLLDSGNHKCLTTHVLAAWAYRDNGKEHGNYSSILGLRKDNGKENGNCYSILGLYGQALREGTVSKSHKR